MIRTNQKTAEIVATAFSQGSKHDFHLFKDDKLDLAQHIRILADAGYQGLVELHENCQTPFKKSKYHRLTKKEKQRNRKCRRRFAVSRQAAFGNCFYNKALEMFRTSGYRRGQIRSLYNLGTIRNDLDEVDEAIHSYLAVRDLARESEDRLMEIMALQQLGAIYLDLDEPENAIQFYQRSLELADQLGDLSKSCQALSELGNAYVLMGKPEKAIAAFRRCSDLARQTQDAYKEGISLFNLGMALQESNREEAQIALWNSHVLKSFKLPQTYYTCGTLRFNLERNKGHAFP